MLLQGSYLHPKGTLGVCLTPLCAASEESDVIKHEEYGEGEGGERDVILKHHIEGILPNSFGLSNTVEGEPGYCRDHLEMREKEAAVLTEDTGRFGGNPRTPSLVLGPEPPLE